MTTANVAVTEGSGKNVATYSISEDAATKQIQRVVLNESDGTEVTAVPVGQATAANSLPVVLASDDPVVAVAGTIAGAAVITDANGTLQQYLRGIVKLLITSGTIVLGAGTALIGKVKTRFIVAVSGTITRPAATDAYAANDAVSNSVTDGSVTSQTITMSDVNDNPITIERMRLNSTDTGVAGKAFRIWCYAADPTADTGIVGADNEAFSTKRGTFIGTLSGTFRTFTDGSVACCVPDEGSRIISVPGSGAATVWILLQTLEAFTPSANSTTFIATAEGFQGAA